MIGFDEIQIFYPLPDPEVVGKIFQTKDMEQDKYFYTIDEDGLFLDHSNLNRVLNVVYFDTQYDDEYDVVSETRYEYQLGVKHGRIVYCIKV